MTSFSFFLAALMLINNTDIRNNERFVSVAEETPLFSFGIIADVQYCNCEAQGTRFYRNSLEKLIEAMNGFRMARPDFVVNLGDLIDRDFKSYDPVNDILEESGLKIYHVTGNHDYQVEERQRKKIPQLKEHKTGYYSVQKNSFRCIFLNGNEISTYTSVSKKGEAEAVKLIERLREEGKKNGQDWNGGMSTGQLEWLDAQLTEADEKGERVLIFCHFPVAPENEHNLLNYSEALDFLGKHKSPIAWFNGHNHAGNYANLNTVHFVNMRGMVETEESGSFALVEVYSNKIWIRGYGREKSQILAY
jgi:predicted phosphodiesterase